MKTAETLSKDDFFKQSLGETPSPAPQHTFELGLVIAGGVSGGAYQAGVLDYLVEALDRWYAAKANGDADVPRHDVRIKVIAGTSAGGINSALLGLAANWGFQPHRSDQAKSVWGDSPCGKSNIFYQTWVEGADIRHLLTTEDIGHHQLPSLLNADFFTRHWVPQALKFEGVPITDRTRAYRNWLTSPLPILLTMTNLKGVPYKVIFNTGLGDRHQANYYMTLHKDYLSFKLTGAPGVAGDAVYPGYLAVNAQQRNKAGDPDWRRFGDAARATSAFPFGLAPVVLNRSYSDYRYRVFYRDTINNQVEYIPPERLTGAKHGLYECVNVDGGVMNNEPFDLALAVLFGPQMDDAAEQALGDKATQGLLVLQAFPTNNHLNDDLKPNIVQLAGRIAGAQIKQARFKLQELIFSRRDNLYTRFLLQPVRPGADPDAIALAGEPLEAFLGFFCREYREHDFQLGRQNCQDFLRYRLKLPKTNPVFKDAIKPGPDGLVPLIPLLGVCRQDEPVPQWPKNALKWAECDDLHQAMAHRLNVIARLLINQATDSRLTRWLARWAWAWCGRGFVLDKLHDAIRRAENQVNKA